MDAKTAVAHKVVNVSSSPTVNAVISGENVVYLMGLSFIIGSLFTIFVLILLDFMGRKRAGKN